ncbi:putative nuclease HARBI1 isoform X1 [Aphis craccivora]|uniref:Putative nuclease HARBI1 isoform X1 n=1 Tax=Aphis craccivora TaxID=307492 RepID=A0A6G0XW20_APHCR|nr:putative nuclease HARBI1 isoform X1 [Aphis craccivora]
MVFNGNYSFSVSQPSVNRCITEVINAFNCPEILNKYIRFPISLRELNVVRSGFYEKFGIPGVIGICDSNMKILNVCSKFSGSTYDSHIWRVSPVTLGRFKIVAIDTTYRISTKYPRS